MVAKWSTYRIEYKLTIDDNCSRDFDVRARTPNEAINKALRHLATGDLFPTSIEATLLQLSAAFRKANP